MIINFYSQHCPSPKIQCPGAKMHKFFTIQQNSWEQYKENIYEHLDPRYTTTTKGRGQ